MNPAIETPGTRRCMHPVLLLTVKEFSDRLRSGWVIACLAVWLGAVSLTSFFGLAQIGQLGAQGYERTVLSLLNLVQYLVPLLGLLLGHDLIAGESEDRTLGLMVAGGLGRGRIVLGKFLGGCLALIVPLAAGFAASGVAIRFATQDTGFAPFLKLAVTSIGLGILFLGIGLALSVFARTRVRALVLSLLTWCVAVFAFDLIALGWVVSSGSTAAAKEIDFVCDATHVNAAAETHASYDNAMPAGARNENTAPVTLGWLAGNPVDLFRAVNLPPSAGISVPPYAILLSTGLWLGLALGAASWKLKRTDI